MKNKKSIENSLNQTYKLFKNIDNTKRGITLVSLVITIIFSYDEKRKCSNNKGFLLATV